MSTKLDIEQGQLLDYAAARELSPLKNAATAGAPNVEEKSTEQETQHLFDSLRRNENFLARGAQGPLVTALQEDLNAWLTTQGMKAINVDGNFGNKTQIAVKDFQARHALSSDGASLVTVDGLNSGVGLSSDGIVGPRTIRALDLYRNRGTLEFAEFIEITLGIWDKSHVQFPWQASDLPINKYIRSDVNGYVKDLNQEFVTATKGMAERLGTDYRFLLAVMDFETSGTFSAGVRNAGSSAVGLIQFTEATAKTLGTTTKELAAMTQLQQLVYVERYFAQFSGSLKTVSDCYLAVLAPSAIGKKRDHVVFASDSPGYGPNRSLDKDADGNITVKEATRRVAELVKKYADVA